MGGFIILSSKRCNLMSRSGAGQMKYVSLAWVSILCALLLAGLAGGAYGADGINKSSNSSELKVALLDFGPIGDHGWTYEAHVGASKMAKKLPYVNLSEKENAVGPNASQIMSEYAKNGYNLIFCHSLNFESAITETAPKYPDTIFMWRGEKRDLAPNVGVYYAKIYEAQYLAGIVAGCMTKTNKIAFPAALPASEVIIGIDAFSRGVAFVNPDARVYVVWIGSWYDPDRERSVAMSLINDGCDIITYWSDSDATGEAAEETGTYFISFGSDIRRFTPLVFLTGVVWNWEPIMTDIVESVHNGTWQSHPRLDWWYGLAEGGVSLAPFSDLVPEDVRTIAEERQREIEDGRFQVFPGMSDGDLEKIHYLEPNVVGSLPD
jgi:basic membrane protein A and related proteins